MKLLSVLAAIIIASVSISTRAHAAVPEISAGCAVVINADTLGVLYGKNESVRHTMASTTKIMTALITLESGDPDIEFTADSMAIKVEGTSMGLREGDIVTRRALCYGMLLPSGNDAANAAAVNIAGSLEAFAGLMNARAQRIGMNNTRFANPSGLDADGHYTTAYDMALLAAEAMKNEDFRAICSLRSAKVDFGNPPSPRTLYNSNRLLSMYDGCIGIKTGFTDNAGRCLVSAAERNGCRLIAVTLDAPDDWNDHRKMLDLGFGMISPTDVRLNSYSAELVGGYQENVSLIPSETVVLGLTEEERKMLSVKYNVPEFVCAPTEVNEPVGFADIYSGDRLIRRVSMTISEDTERVVPQNGLWEWLTGLFGL